MATIKRNQPIIFDDSVDLCNTDTTYYTQIVDQTDTTQFQFGLTVCNGQSDLIVDPNFSSSSNWTLGTGWVISSNTLCRTGSGVSNVQAIGTTLVSGDYYCVTIIVDSISSGAGFGIYLGAGLIGIIQSSGTHVFYGSPNLGLTFNIVSIISGGTICISAASVYKILTNFGVGIYDYDDNSLVQSLFYNTAPANTFVFSEDSVTVSIDWASLGLIDGCYYMCLFDPCINSGGQNYPPQITNGTFTGSASGWTLGSSWTYNSNAVDAVFSATPANNYLTQNNVFINYTSTYSVTVILTAHTGNVAVYFGTSFVGSCTGVGTFVITGVPVGNLNLQLYITSGTATVTSVTATTITTANYVCNYQSNIIKLGDYSCACPETLLINACNDDNGLGFVFNGSGFTPRIRLQGKLRQSKYSSDRIIEEDSDGKKKVIYYNRRKSKNLTADLLPEYVHDFLSTLVGYDRFYINGVPYIVDDDEYNVIYDDSQDNVGGISLLVSEQTQLIRNFNCSSVEQSCIIPQIDCDTEALGLYYLLMESGTTQYIILENGQLIELE